MRFSFTNALLLALAGSEIAVASSWFPGSKAGMQKYILYRFKRANTSIAYNKWHETELERWLSDHEIPYPAPADRKDLESLVKDNWQQKVVDPFKATGSTVDDHYGGVKNWIFDSWVQTHHLGENLLTCDQMD